MSKKPGSRSKRTSSSSSFLQDSSFNASSHPSSSRPFLNMINPMNSTYHGYTPANQSVLEEEGESAHEEIDLEGGPSTIFQSMHEARPTTTTPTPKAQGKRRAGRDSVSPGRTMGSSVLHPNIHKEDKIHETSDDEDPQNFMIEPTTHRGASPAFTGSPKSHEHQRLHSLGASDPRKLPPRSPRKVHRPLSTSPRPAKPSELYDEDSVHVTDFQTLPTHTRSTAPRQKPVMRGLDEYEKALWNWVNVYNLDAFLQEVYQYYEGKGIYSIALSRGLNLLTVGFVIGFSTFLLGCIDYSALRGSGHTRLSDVIVNRCVSKFSGFTLLFFILFTAFYAWRIVTFAMGIQRLIDMYKFYTYLLKIPDADIQTISWGEVVRRIGAIREQNPLTALSSKNGRPSDDTTTAKLDAHDIANRILRQENYLIALFNKDLLDLRVPLPNALESFLAEEEGKGKMLTQALEWNLRFCLMEYLFDDQGKVRKVFLKSKHRRTLIEGLKRRFIFMGILNAIFAPFIVLYLLMYSFFRYFEQYHKDPSSIGGRRYTSYAQWKFREFNELPHIFTRRLDESYPLANMYIGQFPNEKVTIIMRFVAFIAGSFAAVLVLATVLDPDLFLNFEITPHRTVFFYVGVFTAVLTVVRGMIPEENRVFDPELLLTEVITYTHYMPESWRGMLHSKNVHQEFGELFAMKVLIFAQELLSVILTPFVLWLSLPECAPAIIDFFREFTVHVDGRGYVCSFAEFNFERHGNVKFGVQTTMVNDARMVSNEGKMEKSFLHFKAANPDWNPSDPSGSAYLNRIADLNAHYPYPYHRKRQQAQQSIAGGYYPGPTIATSSHSHSNIAGSGSDHAAHTSAHGHVSFANQPGMETSETRAQEYDQALRQSRLAAFRRKGMGMPALSPGMMGNASVMGMSALLATGPHAGAMSVYGGADFANAPSAVLGDSQGSVGGGSGKKGNKREVSTIRDEDRGDDHGVASGLGGSYVDGTNREVGGYDEQQQEDEDELEDAGVLGLLAQIYGRRDGPQVNM